MLVLMKRVVHGSLPDRFQAYVLYPDMIEMDIESIYEGNGSLEAMKRFILPRLREAAGTGNPGAFCVWMPFARRLAERIGYY